MARIPLGFSGEERWLAGGLLAAGLHEAYAADIADAPAALAFALLVAALKRRQAEIAGQPAPPLIWARESKPRGLPIAQPYGPGLAALGIDPATITLLALPDGKAVLRAGLDALRHGAASVLIELAGRQPCLDLTASRRLALAAREGGALALMLRCAADPAPSAAHSRWRVASAPSRSPAYAAGAGWWPAPAPLDMPGLGAPGAPAFALTLLRQRGGAEGLEIVLEWNRDTTAFQERPGIAPASPESTSPPPLFGAVLAMVAGGAGGPRAVRTATGEPIRRAG